MLALHILCLVLFNHDIDTMTTQVEREAEDNYEAENDASPVSSSFRDNSYATETRADLKETVPVQADEAPVEDPMVPRYADTDEQLGMNGGSFLRLLD